MNKQKKIIKAIVFNYIPNGNGSIKCGINGTITQGRDGDVLQENLSHPQNTSQKEIKIRFENWLLKS